MFKYETILYWSNADEAFVAEVPELADCMAHGDTKRKLSRTSIKRWNSGLIRRRSSETPYRNPRASV